MKDITDFTIKDFRKCVKAFLGPKAEKQFIKFLTDKSAETTSTPHRLTNEVINDIRLPANKSILLTWDDGTTEESASYGIAASYVNVSPFTLRMYLTRNKTHIFHDPYNYMAHIAATVIVKPKVFDRASGPVVSLKFNALRLTWDSGKTITVQSFNEVAKYIKVYAVRSIAKMLAPVNAVYKFNDPEHPGQHITVEKFTLPKIPESEDLSLKWVYIEDNVTQGCAPIEDVCKMFFYNCTPLALLRKLHAPKNSGQLTVYNENGTEILITKLKKTVTLTQLQSQLFKLPDRPLPKPGRRNLYN